MGEMGGLTFVGIKLKMLVRTGVEIAASNQIFWCFNL